MKILIIEDEALAAERLKNMIMKILPEASVSGILASVEEGVEWFKSYPQPDLILADIQLADGLSFSIFKQFDIQSYVIFVTAYDEYAIEAFKLNSIDYLLKPIEAPKLQKSIEKFLRLKNGSHVLDKLDISALIRHLQPGTQTRYRSRFLIKNRQTFLTVNADDILYFFIEDQLLFLMNREGKKYLLEYTMNQLEEMLDPSLFFRINRQMFLSHKAIKTIHPYFNSRLLIDTEPPFTEEVIVSREKVNAFKQWLEQ